MNDFGVMLVGCVLRITAFAALGALLYEVSRRRGPAFGSSVALASLVGLVGVSALTLSPWPRWWTVGAEPEAARVATASEPEFVPPTASAVSAGAEDTGASKPLDRPAGVDRVRTSWLVDFGTEFVRELRRAPAQAEAPRWRWPAWAALAFLSGLAFHLLRLVAGLWGVRRCRLRSRPIDDSTIDELVAALRSEMGCRRQIEVRESSEIATPAIVGWLRPTLFLPDDWPDWTDSERRVVLAHEIAHVGRDDYPACVCAQFSLALHFYHPLAHWLADRLRLQQELAADAWGARLAGGKALYLTTLARLALRRDDRPTAWPVRPFLPTRGTLLRRIEMLRDTKDLRHAPYSKRARALTIGTLALAGLLIAGLRGPAGPEPARAQDEPAPAARGSFDLSLVPADAVAFMVIRPAELFSQPGMKPLAESINKDLDFEKTFGVPVESIEQVGFIGFPSEEPPARNIPPAPDAPPGPQGPGRPPGPPHTLTIVRSSQPRDLKSFITQVSDPVKVEHAGKTYFKSAKNPNGLGYTTPDDRTIVFGPEHELLLFLDRDPAKTPAFAWSKALQSLGGGQVALAVDGNWMRSQLEPTLQQPNGALLAPFSPVWEETESLAIGVDATKGANLRAVAICKSEDGAEKVQKTSEALLTLARNSLGQFRQMVAKAPRPMAPPEQLISQLAEPLLSDARVARTGSVVEINATAKGEVADTVKAMLVPIKQARAAARRVQSMNNLKQIGLAMHNYASVHGGFPPALVLGPDGKTPHSWRVAILPFIEQEELYKQYKFDEPWDSPSNKKLLDKIPPIYRAPTPEGTRSDDPTHPSYFVLTGPTTLFSGEAMKEGTNLASITDGTSNTIMAVEAKREIPWTKPEDIPYDPKQPLPKLGGYTPDGFNALFGDGSVRFMLSKTDEQVLRALFTRNGGEVIGPIVPDDPTRPRTIRELKPIPPLPPPPPPLPGSVAPPRRGGPLELRPRPRS